MSDPDSDPLLPSGSTSPDSSSTSGSEAGLYRDVTDAAFKVLRRDLKRARDKRLFPRPQVAVRALDCLEALERCYRELRSLSVHRVYVPARRGAWTLDDKMRVLDELAAIIHGGRRAVIVYGDDDLLRELWEDGCFRSVERLCDEVEAIPVTAGPGTGATGAGARVEPSHHSAPARSEELEWLMATWIPRRASVAANLSTSRRLVPPARRRRPGVAEPRVRGIRRSRTVTRRSPGMRPLG